MTACMLPSVLIAELELARYRAAIARCNRSLAADDTETARAHFGEAADAYFIALEEIQAFGEARGRFPDLLASDHN